METFGPWTGHVETQTMQTADCADRAVVQSFYGKKSVNLPLIATEGFSTVLDSAMYLYLHIKSPKKSHNGKLPKNGIYYEALRPVLWVHENEADLNFFL